MSLYIDDLDFMLVELKRAMKEDDEEVDLLERDRRWGGSNFTMAVNEMYEKAEVKRLSAACLRLLGIIEYGWIDTPRLLGIPKRQADNLCIEFLLTPEMLDKHCGDFESIDAMESAKILLPDPTDTFPDADVLSQFIEFWRDAFIVARNDQKTILLQTLC